MVMSSWQLRRFPLGIYLSSSMPLPDIYPHLSSTHSKVFATQGLSSPSSQQVLFKSISLPFIKDRITSLVDSTSQSPSEARIMYLWAEVSKNSLTSGSQLKQGPLNCPAPTQCSSFLRQQSPMLLVGCNLPLRQQQLVLSSLMISSSMPFHCSSRRALSALLLTERRQLPFYVLMRLPPSERINIAWESPELPMQTLSLCTMAVIPQVPTLLIFLLPIFNCCWQISKKLSYNCLQLHAIDSLRTFPTSTWPGARCYFRQLSIKMLILHLEYSANSGPPWPSKMLTVQASRCFSCQKTRLSSQGSLASYWRDLIRFQMMFLRRSNLGARKGQLSVSMSIYSSPSADSS